jgi:tRNA-(ms[2]io[6]A)-hydroxylase
MSSAPPQSVGRSDLVSFPTMLCLKVPSDPGWALLAGRDLDSVLVDHAQCEMKAASNALSLAARHPDDLLVVRALTRLAREELDHFDQVLVFLQGRGLTLGPPAVDEYAARLRRAASMAPRAAVLSPLVDRLLVGALIEARSCERFKLILAAISPNEDPELVSFYSELFEAEARHYRQLVDLALSCAKGHDEAVLARLDRLSTLEGEIVLSLSTAEQRATIHG